MTICLVCRRKFKPDKYHPHRKYCSYRCLCRRPTAQSYRKIKLAAILAYGGHCNCKGCNVAQIEFLTIDHVKPVRHHSNVRPKSLSGNSLYYRLKRTKYPSDYQVLCYNCNCAKRLEKQCPLYNHPH